MNGVVFITATMYNHRTTHQTLTLNPDKPLQWIGLIGTDHPSPVVTITLDAPRPLQTEVTKEWAPKVGT